MSKPERILLSYVQVRGPALAATYYAIKNNMDCSFDHLRGLFCTPKKNGSGFEIGQFRGCLNFLRAVDLVKMHLVSGEETYRILEESPSMPFRALLLHRLRLADDQSFYEVQSHLARNDVIFIPLDELKRSVEDSLDLDFAWTQEKLNFWMELADFVGLGTRTSSRSFIFYPSPELIHTLLAGFPRDSGRIRLKKFVEYLRSEFFECLTDPDRFQMFRGFQQSLLLLEKQERIRFISMSDDPDLVKVGDKSISLISVKEG